MFGYLAPLLLSLSMTQASPQPPAIAYLAKEPTQESMGPHNRAAWQAAQTLGNATLLLRQPDGVFFDTKGQPRRLADFDVVWYHQGDAIERNAMYRGASLLELRRFAEAGGGVLLSGGALALVAQLRLETQMRPQRHDLDNYCDPAGLIPVETDHPAFEGLTADDGIFWISRRGCRAVADFYWGGPAEGMLLARTNDRPQNPLVEYALGQGRVIVFGWRWPDYEDLANPHRGNLMRLTANLVNYLGDASEWQDVVIRTKYPPLAAKGSDGVSPQQWRALRMAIQDLADSFPTAYPNGPSYLTELEGLEDRQQGLADSDVKSLAAIRRRFESLQRRALLANPLLDFDRLLMIRRRADQLGLPLNFNGNADLPPTGYQNTLVALTFAATDGQLETIYQPDGDRFIGDLDLHYDAHRLLMSQPDQNGRWCVDELDLASRHVRRLPLIDEPDVHNYDACYLPDDRIVFTSTACQVGVPCVGGKSKVANLYLRDHNGEIRRLTNDQDHNWCPTVLNSGNILYQRWEYADIAHAFTRLLFQAAPDGSRQMQYYGSNSFWPTAMFYARPIPNHPSKVVAVIGGHHEAPRQGELVIFDPARGRHEADGAVQRIPGYGQPVQPVILDGLIGNSWPRFLHPYPLSDKYFLVSCKPAKTAHWGVYLVDVFDNFVRLYEEPGWAMLEPTPWRKSRRQPVVANVAEPSREQAAVLLADVYRGPGLQGIPRGTVKSLRLISYEFTFHGLGGEPDRVGFDGPWDVKRILGTTPVEPDGSAHFLVPANTPIAVQPLDAEGKALALMRSWFTAMPGEVLSCVGCHESPNTAPPADCVPMAALREPTEIKPWYGPPRGFSFVREVQPVLDAYCVDCHGGDESRFSQVAVDLSSRPIERVPSAFQMNFTPSYTALRRFVHGHTLESDAHLLPPANFHADTSKLVQILRDDHYGVRLSEEAWDRLITWIDLNAPAHGTWREAVSKVPAKADLPAPQAERRAELNRRYGGITDRSEVVYPVAVLRPEAEPASILEGKRPTGPVTPRPQQEIDLSANRQTLVTRSVQLKDGVRLELVRILPGRFLMGCDDQYPNERPARVASVDQPFWIGRFEVTNRQYHCFRPFHDSGLETGEQYQFGDDERGHPLNRPEQPVVRVSWDDAMQFCRWLSEKTGGEFSLPTEGQWEFACRAGTASSLSYGGLDDDFSRFANLSDATHHTVDYPHVPTALPPWRPADTRFDDGWRVSAPVGTFEPNGWGLYDMHGNVAEWTRSSYATNPDSAGPPQSMDLASRRVVRGGSWLDRPRRARSAFRSHYPAWQAVHDVGFRVVCFD